MRGMLLTCSYLSEPESYTYKRTQYVGPTDVCFSQSPILKMTCSGCLENLPRFKAQKYSTSCISFEELLKLAGVTPVQFFLRVGPCDAKVQE